MPRANDTSPREVIAAQRRVLRLAATIIRQQGNKDTRLTDGRSLWTVGEILDLIQQAASAKVDYGRKRMK